MAPREKWTDDRLDDLNQRVNDGFARVEGDIRGLQVEVKKQGESLRAEMSTRLGETEARLEKKIDGVKGDLDGVKGDLEKKIDSLGKSVAEVRGVIDRALFVGVAALILTQIAGGILF